MAAFLTGKLFGLSSRKWNLAVIQGKICSPLTMLFPNSNCVVSAHALSRKKITITKINSYSYNIYLNYCFSKIIAVGMNCILV